jgi:hypothetical protein
MKKLANKASEIFWKGLGILVFLSFGLLVIGFLTQKTHYFFVKTWDAEDWLLVIVLICLPIEFGVPWLFWIRRNRKKPAFTENNN